MMFPGVFAFREPSAWRRPLLHSRIQPLLRAWIRAQPGFVWLLLAFVCYTRGARVNTCKYFPIPKTVYAILIRLAAMWLQV